MADVRAKVLVVDDHPLVREWLSALSAEQRDLCVCGVAENAADAMDAIENSQPDVAVIDIGLKGKSGIELLRDVRGLHPNMALVVLSMHEEVSHAERALRAGAQGYVMKTESTQNIVDAVREVLAGRLYLSERVTKLFAAKFVHKKAPAFGESIDILSNRELQVFGMLGQGHEIREIAEKLELSAKTVHAYCARIREKLNLRNSTHLFLEAVRWYEGGGYSPHGSPDH